jgi:hypothetical protein
MVTVKEIGDFCRVVSVIATARQRAMERQPSLVAVGRLRVWQLQRWLFDTDIRLLNHGLDCAPLRRRLPTGRNLGRVFESGSSGAPRVVST